VGAAEPSEVGFANDDQEKLQSTGRLPVSVSGSRIKED